MDLENIMLSKTSWTEKDKYCLVSIICEIEKKEKGQVQRKRELKSSYQKLQSGKNRERLVHG